MTFFLVSVFIVMVMWRPQEWLVPWLFGWPILNVVIAVSLLTFVVERDAGKIDIPRRVPQLKMLFWLWVAAVMSHVANTYFAGMMETIPDVFKICFFTALLIVMLDRVEKIRTVCIVLVVMTCFMAWHALLQQEQGYGFGGQAPLFDPRYRQEEGNPFRSMFYGIFHDPNDLAQILVTGIPLAFIIPRRMNIISFAICCAVSYLLLMGFFATQSRGGMIGLAALIGVVLTLALPARWLPAGMVIMILGALFASTLAGPLLDTSAYERVVFWGMGNEVFKSHLIFGMGHGMFWQVASSRAAHNAFVSCYVELGLFGYIFWFGLLYLGVMGAWRTRFYLKGAPGSRERWLRRSIGLLIAATVSFSASSYFLSRTFLYPFFFLIALLAAVPVAAREFLPEGAEERILTRRDVVIAAPIIAVVSVIYIYFSIVFLNRAFHG